MDTRMLKVGDKIEEIGTDEEDEIDERMPPKQEN